MYSVSRISLRQKNQQQNNASHFQEGAESIPTQRAHIQQSVDVKRTLLLQGSHHFNLTRSSEFLGYFSLFARWRTRRKKSVMGKK
jgi:hypothetical protein